MKKLTLVTLLVLLSGLNLFAQTKIAPKITAIRAQLFFDGDGTFSEDMLKEKDVALWNTIIGEGWAGKPSTSTFVTVEISGKDVPLNALKAEITALGDKNKVLLRKIVDVDLYDRRTKFYAPFWLYNTGCEKIKLSARLIGRGAPAAAVTKIIPFNCGE